MLCSSFPHTKTRIGENAHVREHHVFVLLIWLRITLVAQLFSFGALHIMAIFACTQLLANGIFTVLNAYFVGTPLIAAHLQEMPGRLLTLEMKGPKW